MAKKKASPSAEIAVKGSEASPLQRAAPLSGTVTILDVSLSAARVVRHDEAADAPDHGFLKVGTHTTTQGIASEAGEFWVVIPFSLVAARNEEDGFEGEPIFSVEASFRLTYRTSEAGLLTPPVLEAFAMTNGVYNAWPYWREFAQNTTARMGIVPVILPVFRL